MKEQIEEIKKIVEAYPNDMELGGKIREFINSFKETENGYNEWKEKWDTKYSRKRYRNING